MQRDQLLIEKEAEEFIKKKEAVKPPQKISRYKLVFRHFYVMYFLLFLIIIMVYYG